MDESGIERAAQLLNAARSSRRLLAALPEEARPQSFADAAAVQERVLALSGEKVAGYKLAGTDPASVMWGAVLASRVFASPATIEADLVPLLGVELEIAFRLDREVAADDLDWDAARFDSMVTALPLIEIVDTRFASYRSTPLLHRAADFMSNGAVVTGPALPDWRSVDLERLPVRLSLSGRVVAEGIGGHGDGDPRRTALAFLAAPAQGRRLPAGTFLTTGTYTGLQFAERGDRVEADAGPFGRLEVAFSR
ncbi:2-keto-4-pentenoate hydratase [Ancylobacter mangrovi]|uniref:2-keto-4-pentenoate hydratase n=1 Tax=Ancylobacter mangrovi TaxID=2972472 RepID=UPI0021611B3E|nr:fumarylacetoacetate hydrolase family protein [Ancylobacter mangrovi]MCS0500827.1 fumarylacetoacetate hydrolase family protein [Ancylobacter mangrovi]